MRSLPRTYFESADLFQKSPARTSPTPELPASPVQTRSKKRKRNSLLADLNPQNIISVAYEEDDVTESQSQTSSAPASSHQTRASTAGTQVSPTRIKYNERYHPMDEHTRPTRAAKLRSQYSEAAPLIKKRKKKTKVPITIFEDPPQLATPIPMPALIDLPHDDKENNEDESENREEEDPLAGTIIQSIEEFEAANGSDIWSLFADVEVEVVHREHPDHPDRDSVLGTPSPRPSPRPLRRTSGINSANRDDGRLRTSLGPLTLTR
jgi:hypothetical protein